MRDRSSNPALRWGVLGLQGSNPGFLDQNQACFLYTKAHSEGFESAASTDGPFA